MKNTRGKRTRLVYLVRIVSTGVATTPAFKVVEVHNDYVPTVGDVMNNEQVAALLMAGYETVIKESPNS